MKVYYLTRKRFFGAGMVFLLIFSFLGLSLVYFNKAGIASNPPEAIYQGNSGKKIVAITVNVDWGEEFIPLMLKEFEKNKASVTFFVTGKWAQKNPELLKEMHNQGHSIQNHGYEHLHFNSLSAEQIAEQIKKADQIIAGIIGKETVYFAPPYGEFNRQVLTVASDLNYHLIMWSVDTIDWQRPEPSVIEKRVMNKVHNDAIILMHPTDPTVKALPGLLKSLSQEGYKMVTLNEMLASGGGGNEANDGEEP
ncbi:MAG: polysaccharide deacetylase family protein [Syntrophomonadaceae bacterium]